jgi:hypothetical protein
LCLAPLRAATQLRQLPIIGAPFDAKPAHVAPGFASGPIRAPSAMVRALDAG